MAAMQQAAPAAARMEDEPPASSPSLVAQDRQQAEKIAALWDTVTRDPSDFDAFMRLIKEAEVHLKNVCRAELKIADATADVPVSYQDILSTPEKKALAQVSARLCGGSESESARVSDSASARERAKNGPARLTRCSRSNC
jgi:hypothetical protein